MTELETADSNEFALVYRWLDDADVVHVRLLVLITDVPASTDATQVKSVVNLMSKAILDGTEFAREHDYDVEVNWTKGFKLVSPPEWTAKLKAEIALLKERALETNMQVEGVRVAAIYGCGVSVWMDDDLQECCRLVSYSDLMDELKGEKRVTLRLPLELHSLLASAAYAVVSSSLNSFCIKKLAEAVEYDEAKLEEFEGQRRKPGRPKKVQDGE